MMGWLSSAGSMARIVGPVIAAGAMSYSPNGRLVFILMMALMGGATLVTVASYGILRPRSQQEIEEKKTSKV